MLESKEEFTHKYLDRRVFFKNPQLVYEFLRFAPNKSGWESFLDICIFPTTVYNAYSDGGVYRDASLDKCKTYTEALARCPDIIDYESIRGDFVEVPFTEEEIQQIEEEYRKLKPNMEINLSEILTHFKNGVERWKVDDQGKGSIEEIYGLTTAECIQLFKNPLVKGRKVTKIKKEQQIIES